MSDVKKLLESIPSQNPTVVDVVNTLSDDGKRSATLTVSTKHEQKPLDRSGRREHVFYTAAALAAYLKEYKSEDTVVFVDLESMSFWATLDEKKDQGGREILRMIPQIHPLLLPWLQLAGKKLPMADFGNFVRAMSSSIVKPDARELALTLNQIRISESVEVQSGRGAKALNGVMISTKIQGTANSELVELPEVIQILVPIYVGSESINLEFHLILGVDNARQALAQLVIVGLEALKLAEIQKMEASMRNDPDLLVVSGKPNLVEWDTVD